MSRAQRVLEERARALARPLAAPEAAPRAEVVCFTAGEERFAVEARHVVEVFRLAELTTLPGAPPPVAGVTAWRGGLLTLHDPGTTPASRQSGARVIVLGEEEPVLGLLADTVEMGRELPLTGLGPAPTGRPHLRGVSADAVLVLDALDLMRTYTRE